ncbi:MAG: hypothetical protein AABW45_03510 [Nanoarchaeota archaeon]
MQEYYQIIKEFMDNHSNGIMNGIFVFSSLSALIYCRKEILSDIKKTYNNYLSNKKREVEQQDSKQRLENRLNL